MTIKTRQNSKGNWWCNGTINGYDESFEAATIETAREAMIDFLSDSRVSMAEIIWEEPAFYPVVNSSEETLPAIGNQPFRIDTDMV